tara:strand:- start:3057 stop:3218 length:162 start_codon:yes stop_codon:yes gene_type:complete
MSNRYEPTEEEIATLVRVLRVIWTKYEKGIYDDDDVLGVIETLLYHTGVMQEE